MPFDLANAASQIGRSGTGGWPRRPRPREAVEASPLAREQRANMRVTSRSFAAGFA